MLHLSAIYLPIYGMNNQIGLFSRVHPNTHSNTIVVRNGFAWAVRIARDVYGPLQVHVNGRDKSKGVMVNPS